MKKIFAMLAITAIGFGANAQTGKGTWLVGGSAGFNSEKSAAAGSSSVSILNISPNAGYFFMDNLAAGLSVSLISASGSGSTATQFNAGPMVRYYFTEIGSNAKLFAHANFGFGSTSYTGASSVSSTNWGIKAGPAFFLTKNVALEATLGYGSSKVKDADAVNSFGVNFGFQVHL